MHMCQSDDDRNLFSFLLYYVVLNGGNAYIKYDYSSKRGQAEKTSAGVYFPPLNLQFLLFVDVVVLPGAMTSVCVPV